MNDEITEAVEKMFEGVLTPRKDNDIEREEAHQALTFATKLQHLKERSAHLTPTQREEASPFIQHEIDTHCTHLGLSTFTYSEEAVSDKLKSTWNAVSKAFSKVGKVSTDVIGWMRTDGKGMIQNGVNQVKAIRQKRREARDIQIDAGLVLKVEELAKLYDGFKELVDDIYDDYANHRNDASTALRRMRPGMTLVNNLGSFDTDGGNQSLVALEEKVKDTRDRLNKLKRNARAATGNGTNLASLIRDLDTLSTFLEEVVGFVEILEKDETRWEDDKQRLARLFDNEDTQLKGAEGFIKVVSGDSVGSLLRFNTTLIKTITATISSVHQQMNKQQ